MLHRHYVHSPTHKLAQYCYNIGPILFGYPGRYISSIFISLTVSIQRVDEKYSWATSSRQASSLNDDYSGSFQQDGKKNPAARLLLLPLFFYSFLFWEIKNKAHCLRPIDIQGVPHYFPLEVNHFT